MVRCGRELLMPFGLPNISWLGYPLSLPCAGHAGLGLRAAHRGDGPALVSHLRALEPADRRMRFCATLGDDALERHVSGLWARRALVLAGFDGPVWGGPLHGPGPIRAVAELSIAGDEAELGISVDTGLRRRGVGTYLVQTAGALLAPRGVRRIRAYTLPGNASFLKLAHAIGGKVETGPDEVEVHFDVGALGVGYRRRRAAELLRPAA
jgi:GNAT superfamily N-acetyltransferase